MLRAAVAAAAAAPRFAALARPLTRALSASPLLAAERWGGGGSRDFPGRRPPRATGERGDRGDFERRGGDRGGFRREGGRNGGFRREGGGNGGRFRREGEAAPRRTETRDGEPIPQLTGEGVYGIHSVLQALESRHRAVHTLFVRDPATQTAVASGKKKSAADVLALERIHELAAESGVPVSYTRHGCLGLISFGRMRA